LEQDKAPEARGYWHEHGRGYGYRPERIQKYSRGLLLRVWYSLEMPGATSKKFSASPDRENSQGFFMIFDTNYSGRKYRDGLKNVSTVVKHLPHNKNLL
jgi:hypothetical protein